MQKYIIVFCFLFFISCNSNVNETEDIITDSTDSNPPSNITTETDSLNNLLIRWEDLANDEVEYLILKTNVAKSILDTIYLPVNSVSYYDQDVYTQNIYEYLIGISLSNGRMSFSDKIRVDYKFNWINYMSFPSESTNNDISFSKNEKHIASGYGGIVYSLFNRSIYFQLIPNAVYGACSFGNGDTILMGNKLYNIANAAELIKFNAPYTITGKISNDDNFVGLGTSDGMYSASVKIFQIDGTLVHNYQYGFFFNFSNSSSSFVYSNAYGEISHVNTLSGNVISSIKVGDYYINDAVFSSNDEKVAIASGGKVYIWELYSGDFYNLSIPSNIGVSSIEFGHHGEYLYLGTDQKLLLWDIENNREINSLADNGYKRDIELSSSEKYISCHSGDIIKVYESKGEWEIIE